ncbi:MAG TPA: aromatic ring-hydroxylating dioxygenase subunit alpha [Steroidobacteraceae bacterium]|nr:aromatic ring-hydroxylating dioxygenase subunit alpha [Steroidobacteraceae bacterium]
MKTSEVAIIPGLEQTLPSSWYYSEEVYRLERERIFCREWLCAARAEELPNPGDYRVQDIVGESILLVRNREGTLRAFYNVCRHRGSRLCRADGRGPTGMAVQGGLIAGRSIMCPYHQWTYDLDGHLIAAPHLGSVTGFDKSEISLYPVGVECWGGFVFVHLTPAEAQPLAAQLGEIPARIARYPLAELRIGHSIAYEVKANWKSICENYNECYHCGGVHPELCSVVPAFREAGGGGLDWMRGIPHRQGAYTFTRSGTTARRPFPSLNQDERERHKGEVIYPNLFVSLACDHAAVFILQPRGPERTDILCHFLFEPHEIAQPGFDPADAVEFWDVVNRQDWEICESVQRGMRSRVHQFGYYAPMEDFNLDIRRYVHERLDPAPDRPCDDA